MKENFLKVQYMVCWAGCNIPWSDRIFNDWESALAYYTQNAGQLSLRIEQYTTVVKVKIIWPSTTV